MHALAALPRLKSLYLNGIKFEKFPAEPLSFLSSLRSIRVGNIEPSKPANEWVRSVCLDDIV
jgi:hypothetical protein